MLINRVQFILPRARRTAAAILLLVAANARSVLASAKTNLVTTQALAESEYRQAMEICRNRNTEGIPLFQETRASEAVRLLRSAAEKGYIPAAIHLGSHYLTGNGVDQSVRTAFQYYAMAATSFFKQTLLLPALIIAVISGALFLSLILSRGFSFLKAKTLVRRAGAGNPQAQYELALRYLYGKGAHKQVAEARKLFETAAEKGFAPAQVHIGRFFRDGIVVKANRLKGAEWFHKAAAQGDVDGLFLTGQCYEQGAGVPLYLPKALGFYLLASARGCREARNLIETCRQKMNEHQQQAGQIFAIEYSEKYGINSDRVNPIN